MLFRKTKKEQRIDENGSQSCLITYDWVLFKDKNSINHRNIDDYISNIWMLAAGIRETDECHNGSRMLLDEKYISSQEHTPEHKGCSPFGVNDAVTRVVEKRMCKCMYYYNKDAEMCNICKLDFKWKNVGKISIIDCEVPTKCVIKSVGGIDLLLIDEAGNIYSTEIKPQGSKETLVRMMAETYTIVAAGEPYKPAICFFKNSQQCEDFCNPLIYNDTAFQYLLKKIAVFYITTNQIDNIVEFEIHNNAIEPLVY